MSRKSDKDRFKQIKVVGILALLAVVSVISAIYVAVLVNQPETIVTTREGNMQYLTDEDIAKVNESARGFLKSYDLSDGEIAAAKIVVREGTVRVTENKYDGSKTIRFLIDIDHPRLTYDTSIVSGTDEIFMSCPAISLMQDPGVFCVGNERESTIDVALGSYLPFDTGTESDQQMYISLWKDFDKETQLPVLRANVGACEEGEDGEEARKFINDWIREHGRIDPAIIPLKIHYVSC